MRTNRSAAILVFAAANLAATSASAQTWTDFRVGSTTRKALVYVPSGIQKPPLLLSLHGMGIGASWNQGGMMKFERIADREKFIVVYPEADQDLRWDLGGNHDIDFVLAIIDDMSRRYDIDRDRVYASGFSMGGMFSYTLACKIPDKIAAIAPGNGYPLGGESGCTKARPVPIFHMHGTADDFVKYSGIHAFLKTKVTEYGCPSDPVTTKPYPADKPASQSFKEFWGPCSNAKGQRSEISLVSVTGMIHDWATAGKANTNTDPKFAGKPFDIDGSEEAWAFLKRHSLQGGLPGGTDAGAGTADGGRGSSDGGPGRDGAADRSESGSVDEGNDDATDASTPSRTNDGGGSGRTDGNETSGRRGAIGTTGTSTAGRTGSTGSGKGGSASGASSGDMDPLGEDDDASTEAGGSSCSFPHRGTAERTNPLAGLVLGLAALLNRRRSSRSRLAQAMAGHARPRRPPP